MELMLKLKNAARLLKGVVVLALLSSFVFVRTAYAADITVTTFTDELNTDGDCSLREAIQAANTDAAVDACSAGNVSDLIILSAGTYTINISGIGEDANVSGDFDITDDAALTIVGAGMDKTIIDGGLGDRVFHVTSMVSVLHLDNLTVQNGLTVNESGGGILSAGNLELNHVIIKQNFATGTTTHSGGGICIGCGSGSGSGWIRNSIISGNSGEYGGGLFSNQPVLIENSSILSNTALVTGSAISSYDVFTLTNSLVDGNIASGAGVAILNSDQMTITNSTLSHNTSGAGGGALNNGSLGTLSIGNTILADNSSLNCAASSGSFNSLGHNLSSDTSCSLLLTLSGDQNNVAPLLGDLQENGFHKTIRPLLSNSPAIDAADPALCPLDDQRHAPRLVDGDGDGSAVCDIGAMEFIPRLYVDDSSMGIQTGLGWANAITSLQEALSLATPGTHIWVAQGAYYPDEGLVQTDGDRAASFDLKSGVWVYGGFAGTETALGQRNVTANLSILSGDIDKNDVDPDGNFVIASPYDIRNNNSYHVVSSDAVTNSMLDGFYITAGYATGSGLNNSGAGMLNTNASAPALYHLTFIGNSASYGGAGMANLLGSTPYISDVFFNFNVASYGGGMFNNGSAPGLDSTSFSYNVATFGGAVENILSSHGTFRNVTMYGNTATSGFGGGLYNSSSNPTLTNVTISGNDAPVSSGGGLYNENGHPVLYNVIIANSTSGGDCVNSGSGSLNAASTHNLIEDASNSCGLTNGVSGHKVGVDPKLGDFLFYGSYTPTFNLLVGSPAINAGDSATCASSDQRGVLRPQGARCEIGSYESTTPIFADVAINYWANSYIERLYDAGITGGCSSSPLNYCPGNSVTRAQMAIFLLRGMHGSTYTPPAATGTMFTDVSAGSFGAAWIEQLANEGITSGCGGGNFCPNTIVTRAQMAIFLVRAKHGIAFVPPAATGIFPDVPVGSFGANFIEQLVADSVTSGCGGGLYCPSATVKRDSMAVFLVKNFNLP